MNTKDSMYNKTHDSDKNNRLLAVEELVNQLDSQLFSRNGSIEVHSDKVSGERIGFAKFGFAFIKEAIRKEGEDSELIEDLYNCVDCRSSVQLKTHEIYGEQWGLLPRPSYWHRVIIPWIHIGVLCLAVVGFFSIMNYLEALLT